MLQSFVPPVMFLPASLCTASNCSLLSTGVLSQTALLHSSKRLINEIYIFLRACLLISNFECDKFNLVQAAVVILLKYQ